MEKNLIGANLAMGEVQKKSYFVTHIEFLNVCIRKGRGTKVRNTFVKMNRRWEQKQLLLK